MFQKTNAFYLVYIFLEEADSCCFSRFISFYTFIWKN